MHVTCTFWGKGKSCSLKFLSLPHEEPCRDPGVSLKAVTELLCLPVLPKTAE